MPPPFFSVIIPTFNRADYLIRALHSVLRQSYRDYEVIVVDDGSTDGTGAALEPFRGCITYVCKQNSGVSAARNTGILKSLGSWIGFLDSDDEWAPDYLATQAAHILEFPRAVAHVTNVTLISRDSKRANLFGETKLLGRFKSGNTLLLERPLSSIARHATWFLQSIVIRRGALLRAGLFDTTLSIAEDIKVITRAALEGPFTLCSEELVEIYRRPETMRSLTLQAANRGINKYRAFARVYGEMLGSSTLTKEERRAIRRVMGFNRRALGNNFVLMDMHAEARQAYLHSLSMYPSLIALVKYVGTFFPKAVSAFLLSPGVRQSDKAM